MFAVLLLAWTTADLCGGFCVHDRERLAASVPAGPHGAQSVGAAAASTAECERDNGPDDCFCCSHYVDVQVRFQVAPTYGVVATVESDAISHPQLSASPLYHPPLA
jgi:hypothetical protein